MSGINWKAYFRITRTATYGFLASLPLLLLYEGLILFANGGRAAQVRVGAEVWMKQLLALVGGTGMLVLSVVVLLVGIGIFLYERKKSIPIRPRYFGWIVGESAVYAVAVAIAVSTVVGTIFTIYPVAEPLLFQSGGLMRQSIQMKIALSIGAGLYEELLFRVILVGGLFVLMRRLFVRERAAYFAAAVVGALLFSAVHYIGALGDTFTLPSFTFRFLFGLMLNGLFLARGFAVAAWTHALYDIMVVTDFFR